MSQRHRTEAAALPPREELRAHARSERHRISSELHTLSTVVGHGMEHDDVVEPGVAWKPMHHQDAERAKAKAAGPTRVRHWKLKSWKRRSTVRRQKAVQLRLATDDG